MNVSDNADNVLANTHVSTKRVVSVALLRRYVAGPGTDQPIAMVTAAGARSYFHVNQHGVSKRRPASGRKSPSAMAI